MHGKKLVTNWELKNVLPYGMKRYCLILCYLFSVKNKNTKTFFFSSHTLSFSSLSIIFVFAFWIWCGDEPVFKNKHLTQNWVTNLKRQTNDKFIDVKLGSHRSDHICRLGRQNLISLDLSPKVRRQGISTNCPHQC